MRKAVLCALFVLAPSLAFAQASGSKKIAWDQPDTDAKEAQTFVYKYYPDGGTTGIVLAGVTCTGAAPVVCSAPFPAFTPGNHTLQLTAGNAVGESAKSPPFAFTFVVVPSVPVNIRIP